MLSCYFDRKKSLFLTSYEHPKLIDAWLWTNDVTCIMIILNFNLIRKQQIIHNLFLYISTAALSRYYAKLSALELPDVQLACSTVHDIIDTALSDPKKLELAVELLDFIYVSCPEAVVFKLYSKLVVGLKMLVGSQISTYNIFFIFLCQSILHVSDSRYFLKGC